jgi:hypothetical protein
MFFFFTAGFLLVDLPFGLTGFSGVFLTPDGISVVKIREPTPLALGFLRPICRRWPRLYSRSGSDVVRRYRLDSIETYT